MANKPPFSKAPASSKKAQDELDSVEKQFERFEEEVQSMNLDSMNKAPKLEEEQQTKLSQKEIANSKEIYLKPFRSIPCANAFNEKYRSQYNFQKEFVQFVAENKEIIGEKIESWTKPFAGVPAELWHVPVNKPVWGPRYLAEQIKRCSYHRLSMDENKQTVVDGQTYFGAMVVENTVQRLDAHPVSEKKSLFMNASNF